MININSPRRERTHLGACPLREGGIYTLMILDSLDCLPEFKLKNKNERRTIMLIEFNFVIRFGSKTKKITIQIEW